MNHVQTVVLGAGVVGLAVARELARAGTEVLVLEAAPAIGTGVSSRNSEVIHAGIYYDASLPVKANLCVEGRNRLYTFCRDHGVEYWRAGKVVVATSDDQRPALRRVQEVAVANGVHDLRYLAEAADVRALEPNVTGAVAGLFSPSTGIVDSHGFMLALQVCDARPRAYRDEDTYARTAEAGERPRVGACGRGQGRNANVIDPFRSS